MLYTLLSSHVRQAVGLLGVIRGKVRIASIVEMLATLEFERRMTLSVGARAIRTQFSIDALQTVIHSQGHGKHGRTRSYSLRESKA